MRHLIWIGVFAWALLGGSYGAGPLFASEPIPIPYPEDSADTTGEDADEDERAPIDPLTAPLHFETPHITTNIRPVYLYHKFPETSVFKGGNVQVAAVQLRWAATDRLALIATQDGFVDFNPDAGSDETGWMDLTAGAKYAVIQDEESGVTVTPGLTYQLTQGSRDVFQGNGEGVWRPFVSGALELEKVKLMANVGWNLPVDGSAESQFIDYHLHASLDVHERIVPLVELNGYTYTNGGRALAANFEAVDYGNLGSNNVDGNDIITMGLGSRVRITDKIHFGAGYEFPLTERRDIFGWRATVDFVINF